MDRQKITKMIAVYPLPQYALQRNNYYSACTHIKITNSVLPTSSTRNHEENPGKCIGLMGIDD